jgi:hypothetical protein
MVLAFIPLLFSNPLKAEYLEYVDGETAIYDITLESTRSQKMNSYK